MISGKLKFEYKTRIFFIFLVSIGVIIDVRYIGSYLILLLLFLLNSQLRVTIFKDKAFLISLFIDFILIYFIYKQFEGYTFLLLFITMQDGVLFTEHEGNLIAVIAMLELIYLIKTYDILSLSVYTGIYIIFYITVQYVKYLRDKLNETEMLYDSNRRYSYELEDAKKRIEEYSRKVESMSQAEERNRISTEIHDTVGHKLTGVLMQLEATIRLFESNSNKDLKILYSVRDNLRNCVEILRQTVKSMKPKEYSSRILSMRKMIEEFSKDTGIEISFVVAGTPVKLFPGSELTLYKNTQEAITNAVRHGNASKITVELLYESKKVVLSVSDNGRGCDNVIKGMGLTGMEERVELLGGSIRIDNCDGFKVVTIIPINEV